MVVVQRFQRDSGVRAPLHAVHGCADIQYDDADRQILNRSIG